MKQKPVRYRVYVWDRWYREKTGLDFVFTQRGPAEERAAGINRTCPNMEAEVREETDNEE